MINVSKQEIDRLALESYEWLTSGSEDSNTCLFYRKGFEAGFRKAQELERVERVEKKRKRTKDTYKPQSYEEHKAKCRENARKRAHDPKVIEAHRKTAHAWYEAHKHDKTFIERRKKNQARYRKKVKDDPVKNAARKAYMHDYGAKRYAAQKRMEAESLESWK